MCGLVGFLMLSSRTENICLPKPKSSQTLEQTEQTQRISSASVPSFDWSMTSLLFPNLSVRMDLNYGPISYLCLANLSSPMGLH